MNSVTGRGCIIVCSAKKLDKEMMTCKEDAGLAQWRSRCFRGGGVGRTYSPLMDWPNGDFGVSGMTVWDVPARPFGYVHT